MEAPKLCDNYEYRMPITVQRSGPQYQVHFHKSNRVHRHLTLDFVLVIYNSIHTLD